MQYLGACHRPRRHMQQQAANPAAKAPSPLSPLYYTFISQKEHEQHRTTEPGYAFEGLHGYVAGHLSADCTRLVSLAWNTEEEPASFNLLKC